MEVLGGNGEEAIEVVKETLSMVVDKVETEVVVQETLGMVMDKVCQAIETEEIEDDHQQKSQCEEEMEGMVVDGTALENEEEEVPPDDQQQKSQCEEEMEGMVVDGNVQQTEEEAPTDDQQQKSQCENTVLDGNGQETEEDEVPTEGPQEPDEIATEQVDWQKEMTTLRDEFQRMQEKCGEAEKIQEENKLLREEKIKLEEEMGGFRTRTVDMEEENSRLKRSLDEKCKEKLEVEQSFEKFRISVGSLSDQFMELNEHLQEHFKECCKNPNKVLATEVEENNLQLQNRLDNLELFTQDKFQVWTTEQLIMQEELMNAKDKIIELQQRLEENGRQVEVEQDQNEEEEEDEDEMRLVIVSVESTPLKKSKEVITEEAEISLPPPVSAYEGSPELPEQPPSPPSQTEAEVTVQLPPVPVEEPEVLVSNEPPKDESTEMNKSAYRCVECGTTYLSEAVLYRHQKTAHTKSGSGGNPTPPKRTAITTTPELENAPPPKRRRISLTPFAPPPPTSNSDSDDDIMIIEEASKPVVKQISPPKPVFKIMSSVAMSFTSSVSKFSSSVPTIITSTPKSTQDAAIVPLKVIQKKAKNSFTGKRHSRDITKRRHGFYCICGIKFISRRRLDGHLNFHNVIKIASAAAENGSTSDESGLIPAHRIKKEKFEKSRFTPNTTSKKHHAVDPSSDLQCTCGYQSWHRSTILSHIKYYTADRKYTCDLCPKLFLTRSYLKMHYRSSHKKELKRSTNVTKKKRVIRGLSAACKCEECGIFLGSMYYLYTHMITVHKKKNLDKRKFYEKFRKRSGAKNKLSKSSEEGDGDEWNTEDEQDPNDNSTLLVNPSPVEPQPKPRQEHKVDHRRRHKGFFCTCGLNFSTGKKLRNHLRLRMEAQREENEDYTQNNPAGTKKKVTQNKDDTEGFKCMACGEIFNTNLQRIQHRMQAHGHGLLTK